MTDTPFSATASAVGYLFQCRYALLEGLRRLSEESSFIISIETLDDVVFEKEGEATELLQAKHHLNKAANLTDASPDLWKTIRIWCEGISKWTITEDSIFYLVTTANAPKGSAAYYLKSNSDRDVIKSLERLRATSATSSSRENEAGYKAFRALHDNAQQSLLMRVYVLDASPNIDDLDSVLRKEIFHAVNYKFLPSFLQRLEGWWFRRVIKHFVADSQMQQPILSEELQDELIRLRAQFKTENLPIDDDLHGLYRSIEASGYEDSPFVQQLRLIDIGNPRILHAIRNYLKAFEQRSRWIREDLLLVGELDRYEDQLFEEWELYFDRMKDDLSADAIEDAKKRAAKALYNWVETDASIPIRSDCREAFITRGSYQILADRLRVGWHPEFQQRLQHLLESQGQEV